MRQILAAALITSLAALGGCKTTGDLERVASNRSGQQPSFFNDDLLKGRVLIAVWRHQGPRTHYLVNQATWFNPARSVFDPVEHLHCRGENRRYESDTWLGWPTSPDGQPGNRTAVWHTRNDGSDLIAPVFWDPVSGRYHEEWWIDHAWRILKEGWVQDSWPRLMADACPELTKRIVEAGVPINEAQTSPFIWGMLAQDPEAPHRRAATGFGGHVRVPGSAGSRATPFSWWDIYEKNGIPEPPIPGWPPDDNISAAPAPTPEAAFIQQLKDGHGKVFTDPIGRAYVLSVHPDGDELWAIDENDRLLDVGHLRFDADTREVVLDWETLPPDRGYRHRIGERLPVVNTGRTHPAFDLARHIAGLEEDQVLPFHGRLVTFRLEPDGTLLARRPAGDVPGTWRVSRGRLVLQVDGIPDRAGYRWPLLAERMGWTGDDDA